MNRFLRLFATILPLAALSLAGQTIYTPYHFTTIAGLAGSSGTADGVGAAARFSQPKAVAVDSNGNVYIADTANDTIRKITPATANGSTTWTTTTLAGTPGVPGVTTGTGSSALFDLPSGIFFSGSVAYVFEARGLESFLQAVTPTGVVTNIVDNGNSNVGGSQQNTSSQNGGSQYLADTAQLEALVMGEYAIGPNSNQYEATGAGGGGQPGIYNHAILEYNPIPLFNTVATQWVILNQILGTNSTTSIDGPMGTSSADRIMGITVDGSNNVYFTDFLTDQVRKITRTVTNGVESWYTTTLGGVAATPGGADGTGAAARFYEPWGLAVDSKGAVYVADTGNNTIRMGVPDTGPVAANSTANAVLGEPLTFALPATDSFGDPITFAVTGVTGGTATLAGSQATFTPSAVGTGTVTYTASDGYVTNSGTVTISAIPAQPEITLQAASQTVASGHTAVFNASATGYPVPTYQWTLNGSTTIPGAAVTNDSVLMITGTTSADAGTYVCTATNTQGTATTSGTLTVATTGTPGYLTNLSARADVLSGGNLLIVGLGIAGGGSEPMLLRGDGPSVVNVAPSLAGQLLPAPQLTLFDNHSVSIVSNAGWGNAFTAGTSPASVNPVAATTAIFNTVGAFSFLGASSTDAAMAITAPTGNYTAELVDANGGTGIGLAEIYDAGTGTSARLVNLSARADVGAGGNILIGGFNIGGSTAETVLIRGDGPALGIAPFNLAGFLTQPTLSIYSGSSVVYSNTGWGNDATIASTFDTVGAFHLASNSADCALLVTLPPGGYTVEVSGANGTSGVALVEIYEVP